MHPGWIALASLLLLAALVTQLATAPPGRSPPPAPREAPTRGDSRDGRAAGPRVSVIVPARNEARNLPRLLESLTRLTGVDVEVLVVDGGSTDGSRAIVQEHAAADARVRLIEEPPLPEGWVGKCWACWHGREAARGEWLLFTDADTAHAPESLARAIAEADAQRLDLLTGLTLQELDTFAERVAMPPVFTLIYAAAGGPGPERIGDPDLAIANGQYLLFRTRAYDRLGGHERVRDSVVEDLALARAAARDGLRAGFVDLSSLVRVRMYRGWRDMFDGWRKNVAAGASRTPPRQYALTVLAQAAGMLAAPVALLSHAWPAAALAAAAYALMAVRVHSAHYGAQGPRLRHALLHPVGYAFFALVLATSAFDRLSGRGALWKGRRYPGAR